jgi:serine protease AprX
MRSEVRPAPTRPLVGVVMALVLAASSWSAQAQPAPPGASGTVATRAALAQRHLIDRHGRPLDGRGVSIAIVDTGVDVLHPAFATSDGGSKIVRSLSVVPCIAQQAIDSTFGCVTDVPATVPTDTGQGGHGTFTAAVAVGNVSTLPDGMNVGGAAPGARVIMLSATTALQGIDTAFAWILQNHSHPCGAAVSANLCPPIRVVSASWGANSPVIAGLEQALNHAGVVTVWAAGNSGGDGSANSTNPDPGANPSPGVLSVASYDDGQTGTRNGKLSDTSSRGSKRNALTWPDISAPGVNITSACRAYFAVCDAVGSSPRNGPGPTDIATYFTGSGTSWAAPHVAGIVAQLFQADPAATPAVIDDAIKSTAHRYGGGGYVKVGGYLTSYDRGPGLIDAYAAALRLGAGRR